MPSIEQTCHSMKLAPASLNDNTSVLWRENEVQGPIVVVDVTELVLVRGTVDDGLAVECLSGSR